MTDSEKKIIDEQDGWRRKRETPSLPESYHTIPVPRQGPWWRKMLAFAGPGYLIAVGYMDPGNWATDLAAGSAFGYDLLFIIFLSNLMAILLQSLAAKLGIATGRDLAQACRDHYSYPAAISLWILCEIAICACDLAEIIGSAIALNLLFNIPLIWGVCLTAFDVLLILYFQKINFRYIEFFVIALMTLIAGCFWFEIAVSNPDIRSIARGLVPQVKVIQNPEMLYIAIGIIGATVMPHNLYLHSSIAQTRKYDSTQAGKKEAIKFITIDSTFALIIAFFINAAILILAAAVFHVQGHTHVTEIQEAYRLLSPLINSPAASTLFALALLASGQNSTLTGTMAGQIVMEGFLNLRLKPWIRRILTRGLAIVPAILTVFFYGEAGVAKLLIFSQVILSLQLGFAVIPLIRFTNDRKKMGAFVNPTWIIILAWCCAGIIVILNLKYVFDFASTLLA
ncbi:MAG: Nramp family divalent metal transporter [Candidatus Protochlamydia sp.]|nr:Nramp family divalent metal transporter [Candidatus Protochlamydia sp.]